LQPEAAFVGGKNVRDCALSEPLKCKIIAFKR